MSGRRPVGMPDVAAGDYAVAKAERLDGVLGFEIVEMSEEHALERFPLVDRVRQRFGLVHGGAYAAMAEMLATEATVLVVWREGNAAMGISNDTSFLRGARGAEITSRARRRLPPPTATTCGHKLDVAPSRDRPACVEINCESLPCPCLPPDPRAGGDGGNDQPADEPDSGSSCTKPEGIQRLVLDKDKYPNIRKHFRIAVRKGWPRRLIVTGGARMHVAIGCSRTTQPRKASTATSIPRPSGGATARASSAAAIRAAGRRTSGTC